jgi:protein-S-isoprenylcysteine O-methyltransferase Ste14
MKPTAGPLPPAYFVLAIVLMVLLRVLAPVARWSWWPWNLVGLVPVVAGLVLGIAGDAQFKKRGTTVKPFQRSSALVTDGVFRVSRHPMYLGMVCVLVGMGIGLSSLTPLLVIPAFAWWMNAAFVIPEERSMEEQFGDAYRAYRSRVRRWL